jgi:nucleotide-binding universal stress UspA family protein
MPVPKTILVPTDFGEPSESALDYAIDFARVFGSDIVLLHAYEIPIMGFPDGALVATAELTTSITESARIGLERQMKTREGSGVAMRAIVKQASPVDAVNEVADETHAELVVMGTHGRRGLPRALLGSVAEKVVRACKVPVLTVHAGYHPSEVGRENDVEPLTPRMVESRP